MSGIGGLLEGLCRLFEGLCTLVEGLCRLVEGLCRLFEGLCSGRDTYKCIFHNGLAYFFRSGGAIFRPTQAKKRLEWGTRHSCLVPCPRSGTLRQAQGRLWGAANSGWGGGFWVSTSIVPSWVYIHATGFTPQDQADPRGAVSCASVPRS